MSPNACQPKPARLISPHQIHSAAVAVAEHPWTRDEAPRADALVTRTPGLAIGVSTAGYICRDARSGS